jgi:hypothetical protein
LEASVTSLRAVAVLVLCYINLSVAVAQTTTTTLAGEQIIDRAAPAVVLILGPEMRGSGIHVVDDRHGADVYIDVPRPFLTFDSIYKMIDDRTGTVLRTGKVMAWDGPTASRELAAEIIKQIRAARPLPSVEKR